MLAAARHLEVPALFAVAPGDRYVSVATMRQLHEATPVRAKRLVMLAEAPAMLGAARRDRRERLVPAGGDGGGLDPGPPPVNRLTAAA
jgi:hypothetical protein